MSAYFQWFFNLLLPVQICPYLADIPLPCTCGQKLWIANFSTKHFHLHHPSLYTNTKKVIHVKYLLATLIQNKSRERINIYLKISYGNRQNSFCFKEPIYCPAWAHQHTLLTLNVGFQVLCNLIKIWDNIY